jgi:hypothetical protein
MNTKQAIQERIAWLTRQLIWIEKHESSLAEIGVKVSVTCGYDKIDIDNPSREQVVKLMLLLGGKWNKETGCGTSINYTRVDPVDGLRVRLWSADPPPSCRIVTEEVHVPEKVIPAHTETKTKLVCIEETKTPTENANLHSINT